MRIVSVLGLLAAATAVAPAAHAEKVKYNARISAKYPAVAASQTVAVVNFNGRDGVAFGGVLASVLQSAELDGSPVFGVRTADSLHYGSANDISSGEVAEVIRAGQRLGADTVITGTITSSSIDSIEFTRQETVCLQSSGFLKCERSGTRNVPCMRVVGNFSVTPRAIRVDSGQMIFSETVVEQGEYTICEGQMQGQGILASALGGLFGRDEDVTTVSVASPEALLDKLRQDVAMKIRFLVAPYNREVEIELKERARGLARPDNEQFGNAIAFGKAGRMDRACSIIETLYASPANQSNVDLLYNMGVCQEVLLPDQPATALEYYARADQLLSRPDKLISDAYLRMRGIVGQSRSLN